MKLRRRILAIGGSKAITLPALWVRAHGLTCGDAVEMAVNGEEVVLRVVLPTEEERAPVKRCPLCRVEYRGPYPTCPRFDCIEQWKTSGAENYIEEEAAVRAAGEEYQARRARRRYEGLARRPEGE